MPDHQKHYDPARRAPCAAESHEVYFKAYAEAGLLRTSTSSETYAGGLEAKNMDQCLYDPSLPRIADAYNVRRVR